MNRSSGSSHSSALDTAGKMGLLWEEKLHDLPENEVWMRHEIGDALEHASGLQYKGRKGDL